MADTEPREALNISPALVGMVRLVRVEEKSSSDGTAITLLHIQLPTLEEVHDQFDLHFAELRDRGDPRADAKERSFYNAIQRDLEAPDVSSDRIVVVKQEFLEL